MKTTAFAMLRIIAVSSYAVLTGCRRVDFAQAAQHTQASNPVEGGTLIWGVATEPACFDPHRSSQQDPIWVARNYIDSLVSKSADGSYAPWLVNSWSIADDGMSYTFNLRDDVHFTDGTPFNAGAVKANLDYIVKNAGTMSASASLLVNLDHTEVVSPYVVRLVMKQPDSTMLESLSGVRLGFISPKALAENTNLCGGGPGIVGTGPFVFGSYQRGQSAVFTIRICSP